MDFDPERDIPNLTGKVVFITGGTAGIGRATLLSLARHKPARLYFTGRNQTAASQVISAIKEIDSDLSAAFVFMDLGNRRTVKAAVDDFLQKEKRLDVLILNAGVCGIAPALTVDGYEIQFGINHMGHFALAKLLLPIMLATAEANHEAESSSEGEGGSNGDEVRVVTLISKGHTMQSKYGIDFPNLKTTMSHTHTWTRYGQSKLANLLFSKELGRRFGDQGIISLAVHPGITGTGLASQMGWVNRTLTHGFGGSAQTAEDGALNVLWAATSEEVENGEVYDPVGQKGHIQEGMDEELARRLWDWSENEMREENIAPVV